MGGQLECAKLCETPPLVRGVDTSLHRAALAGRANGECLFVGDVESVIIVFSVLFCLSRFLVPSPWLTSISLHDQLWSI